MKNSFLISLIFILLCSTCKEEPKPNLSDEKMISVLADLHIAEAAAMSLKKNTKDSIMEVYYQQVFEIHEVKDSAFFKDLKMLRENPTRVEEIYQKVIEKVEQLGVKKIEQDSLKKK